MSKLIKNFDKLQYTILQEIAPFLKTLMKTTKKNSHTEYNKDVSFPRDLLQTQEHIKIQKIAIFTMRNVWQVGSVAAYHKFPCKNHEFHNFMFPSVCCMSRFPLNHCRQPAFKGYLEHWAIFILLCSPTDAIL